MSRIAIVQLSLEGDITVVGNYEFDRDAGGTLILPGGTTFPASPVAGEFFYKTDEERFYRRNDANTAWTPADAAPVESVNGETGDVVLDAADVGADPAGTGAAQAAAAVAAHVALPDPHPQYTTAVEAAAAAPVQSVNGETGTVVLDAGDVGADPAGTAATAVANHEAAGDPHPQYTTTAEAAAAAPVQQVNGKTGVVILNAADVSADPAGTAATAVSNHEAAGDPHPQYTTAAEASAAAPVQSVNAQTGVVVLDAADVGADPSGTAAAAVSAHEAASDPHPGYQLESEKGAANGYASLDGSGQVPASQLGNVAGGPVLPGDLERGDEHADHHEWRRHERALLPGCPSQAPRASTASQIGESATGSSSTAPRGRRSTTAKPSPRCSGRTGAVTAQTGDYTPAQVGADPAGTAATQVALHEAKIDPHPQYTTAAEAAAAAPVQSVNGDTGVVVLDAADVGADPAGTAAAAVSAHEGRW
jgi:hypothetical protein